MRKRGGGFVPDRDRKRDKGQCRARAHKGVGTIVPVPTPVKFVPVTCPRCPSVHAAEMGGLAAGVVSMTVVMRAPRSVEVLS